MAEKPKRYLITSALPYANGPLHIGHLAGAYINADIYARYLRLKGADVAFICGSDEHGAAITIRAKKEGTTPRAIVNKYHNLIKSSFEKFGISFDIYHRTSDSLHHQTAQEIFTTLNNTGKFLLKESEQYYDEQANQFLADRYIKGTCPNCLYEEAYGDQCENCGTSLSPTELINPCSTLSDAEPVLRKTTHWYFPLNEYEDWLKIWILEEHKNWKKNVYGQCKSWLENGLQPRAMTRDLDWGVPVPVDNAMGKVLYVWMDAPIGYISATKQWAKDNGKDWKDYWMNEETNLLHFIGKDNIVFHCITFPAILKAHGGFILPVNVPANEFMNLEGEKISTSRNWAIWLHEYLAEFPGKEDELRYVLTANMPENKDSEFTWQDFQDRINNELVANLGNFVNRVMVLTHKYFNGELPAVDKASFNAVDNEVFAELSNFNTKIEESIEQFKFREALADVLNIGRLGNKYLAETEPWKLFKTDIEATEKTLNIAVQVAANLAITMAPFLPKKAIELQTMLNMDDTSWDLLGNSILPAHHKIRVARHLFDKVEDNVIDEQIAKLHATKHQKTAKEPKTNKYKPVIQFEDFSKIDLRLGTILKAQKVEKTDKLLHFTVDMGNGEERSIISGVAQHYNPEDCVGKQVVVVANLVPRKMRGVESQGMILFGEDESGNLKFVSPEVAMNNGSSVA